MSEKQHAYAQAMIDQIHQQFIKVVKEGRGKRLKETPDTFSGLFWNGEEAVELGPGRPASATSTTWRAKSSRPRRSIDYTPKENVAERLAKRFGASIGAGAVKALQGDSQIAALQPTFRGIARRLPGRNQLRAPVRACRPLPFDERDHLVQPLARSSGSSSRRASAPRMRFVSASITSRSAPT